jgi:hypothetical protein
VLCFDANIRLSPEDALAHPFFNDSDPDGKIEEEDGQED